MKWIACFLLAVGVAFGYDLQVKQLSPHEAYELKQLRQNMERAAGLYYEKLEEVSQRYSGNSQTVTVEADQYLIIRSISEEEAAAINEKIFEWQRGNPNGAHSIIWNMLMRPNWAMWEELE